MRARNRATNCSRISARVFFESGLSGLGPGAMSTRLNRAGLICAVRSIQLPKAATSSEAVATPSMLEGYCKPLDEGGGFTYKTLYFQANDLKKELPRYQRSLAKYKDLDVRIVWGKHDPFLSATEQMPQFKNLLEVDAENVLVLESAKHLIVDEKPDRIVAFIR